MRSKRRVRTNVCTITTAGALLAALAPSAGAQVERNIPTEPMAVDTAYFTGLTWRNIGPNRGGRSIAVAGSAARPLEYYFGAMGGGLWKTVDGGTTWQPVTDGQITSSSVGGVAVCEANPDVVYISTGETQLRGNIIPGDGVYKSTDAGKTWEHVGLREARNFSRVRVDPTDCNTVFAGAFGHYGEPNEERGVYRSTDGGETWEKVLYRDENTGAVDISIDPKNPDVIYAALWEAWRKPWAMSSGGPGSGLFKSTDGGDTWTELSDNPGMPEGPLGKIGVSVSPVDGSRVYAIIEAAEGGVYVSDDAGATWTRTNDERKLRQRAFYYTRIQADPEIEDRVYVLNVQFWRSDDGGKTFPDDIRVPHGDNHDLWIASNDNQRMIEGNDGGANVSTNGGRTWTDQDYSTAQIYRVITTHHFPYFVCGAQQDNSTICVPSGGWEHLLAGGMNGAGGTGDFGYSVAGGESGYIANDPENPDVYYAGNYGGTLDRYDHDSGQARAVNVWPENPMGYSAIDIDERFQWTYPIVFDPQDPDVLYVTSQHVWRSTNEGQSWERISPDLTRAAPETLGPSGGPITLDQTGVETFATVFALSPSRLEPEVIWAASDDGVVHVTRDNGESWQEITPAGAPEFLKFTTIEDSPHRPGTAFLTGNRFLLGDLAPYVYKTTDYGRSWTRITDGLPAGEVARSIREDVVRPGLLYLGTERGVWISFDDGLSWQSLQRNLPATQVADLTVEEHDLVIATHGRGFYILDNIDVLRQIGQGGMEAGSVQLFHPSPTYRGIDRGVIIDYYLPEQARNVTLEILDPQGRVIRTFTGAPADTAAEEEESFFGPAQGRPSVEAGLNRFTWDMRYPGFVEFPGIILWAARSVGPLAVPGSYQARLTVDGQTQTAPFEIRLDPRVEGVTQADLQRRFELALQIRGKVTEANEAILLIRGIEQQIDSVQARSQAPAVAQATERLEEQLNAVEEEIYQVRNRSNQDPLNFPIKLNNKLAALINVVESADAPPTEQSYAVFRELSAALDQQLARLDQVLEQQLPQVNQALRQASLPEIERRALPPAGPGEGLEYLEGEEYKRW